MSSTSFTVTDGTAVPTRTPLAFASPQPVLFLLPSVQLRPLLCHRHRQLHLQPVRIDALLTHSRCIGPSPSSHLPPPSPSPSPLPLSPSPLSCHLKPSDTSTSLPSTCTTTSIQFSRRLLLHTILLTFLSDSVSGSVSAASSSSSSSSTASTSTSTSTSTTDGFIRLPCVGTGCRGVEVRDFRVGTGRAVPSVPSESNEVVTVTLKWTGRLADRYGWPFQQDSDEDVTYILGKDKLIAGFEQGLQGMKEGGKRRLLIPGELGYKDESTGPLPNDFGDRRRLFATVLNKRRYKNGGDLVIDVQLKKVR